MSIRIHKLAEELGLDNKDMMALLKERRIIGPDVKSVSSTVDNINAQVLREEFASKGNVAVAPPPPASIESEAPATPVPAPPVDMAAPGKVVLPPSVFVRSKEDVDREKEAVQAARAIASGRAPATSTTAPFAVRPPVAPATPGRTVPPAPRFTSAPSSPPAPRPAPSSPPPVVVPVAARPAPSSPAPTPVAAPTPAVAPVSSAGTGSPFAPSPPAPMAKAPTAPPPLPPRIGASPTRPPGPGAVTIPTAPPTAPVITIEGDIKKLHLKPPIVVRDFAAALGLKPFKLISELNQLVGFASMNSNIDEAVAAKVAEKYGFVLDIKHRTDVATVQAQQKERREKNQPSSDDTANLVTRPPVVVILGHVDHGKTSLLDAIRQANVAEGEAGGITQHIGAYQIEFSGRKITFLDTPGHAAFSKMRARGANVTDIAVLVVAADDGFMPQTDEALSHAQAAKVALIVAVNKMDVKGANLDQVKTQMQQRNIAAEDWGGETITVPVSALKKQGIDSLLEMILLQADVLELKANPKAEASGVIIESEIDFGRGPLATVIVQRGTLRPGDAIVCGAQFAKVRAMYDDKGETMKEAPPSTPVRVIGWSGTPDSGATFRVVKNSREAEKLAEEEQFRLKQQVTTSDAAPKEVSVEQLFANIAATTAKVLKLIIKTDVFGSAEAIRSVLENIKSTKVSLEIVSIDVGLVTKNDVLMAGAAGSVIIGFHTKLENGVTPLAKHHAVRVETFEIIYELGDRVRDMMADLLDPDLKETKTGAGEVRQVFPQAKGFVAGCLVTEGKITRNASARLRRGRETVHEGKVATLRRFKDDANEVRAGLECGIKLDDFNGYQTGDIIECFEVQKVRAAL